MWNRSYFMSSKNLSLQVNIKSVMIKIIFIKKTNSRWTWNWDNINFCEFFGRKNLKISLYVVCEDFYKCILY